MFSVLASISDKQRQSLSLAAFPYYNTSVAACFVHLTLIFNHLQNTIQIISCLNKRKKAAIKSPNATMLVHFRCRRPLQLSLRVVYQRRVTFRHTSDDGERNLLVMHQQHEQFAHFTVQCITHRASMCIQPNAVQPLINLLYNVIVVLFETAFSVNLPVTNAMQHL